MKFLWNVEIEIGTLVYNCVVHLTFVCKIEQF
jgi:hypothetical protein